MRKTVLITNDDGAECRFLHELALAVAVSHRVIVVAPDGERSWIGRAFSRNADVAVRRVQTPGAEKSWAVSGTPADCVNIALGHLATGADAPDIVLSGINIGYNVSMPLGLSSGTMAGAIEGAAWGLRAAAFSLDLAQDDFERLRHHRGEAAGDTLATLRRVARRAAAFTDELLAEPAPADRLLIRNYNFPRDCADDAPTEDVAPAHLRLGSLFREAAPGVFRFVWNDGSDRSGHDRTDLAALSRGSISRTTLDFSGFGARSETMRT